MTQNQIKNELAQFYRSLEKVHTALAIAIEQNDYNYEFICFNRIDEFSNRIIELERLIK
jgi:hypothetical protein